MEKYGEIPPRFTRAWWEYFWEYYRWYVIGGAFVIILVAVWAFQCTHRPKYDMNIVYAGHMTYSEPEQQKICEIAASRIPDIDGNGENAVMFQPLVFSDGAGNEEYDYAVQTKLDLTFVDNDTYIYLMDGLEAALYVQRENITETFENTAAYAPDTSAEIISAPDGTGYAVSLSGSRILNENGINCDNLYLMLRVQAGNDEKSSALHEAASELAKLLTE